MATVFWDFEGIVLTDYLQHSRTITGTYCADLIRKCRAALKEKRRGKLRCGVQCHHQATPAHTLYWLTLTSSDRHPNCRFQTASPPIVFGRFGPHWLPFVAKLKNNSWKNGNLLTTMMLFASQMAGWRTNIKNSSTMAYGLRRIAGPSAFLSKGTMLKSDKIFSSYSVVNYIRLRTFWTPLVYTVPASTKLHYYAALMHVYRSNGIVPVFHLSGYISRPLSG